MFIAVVPAYQEQENICQVVNELQSYVDEVVVVDDGSTDKTSAEAQQAGAKVITHEINRGQGAALETGRRYALVQDAEFLLFFDGDGQFKPEEIDKAIAKLKQSEADILFGSRFIGDNSQIPITKRYLLLPLAKLVDRFFTDLPLTDAHNGFRILAKKSIEKIEITQDRMAHATEIPRKVKKYELDYVEFPTEVRYKEYGQNFIGGMKILEDLILGKFID
ncbi:MAG: glycosyltransferase family 2 protein [Parcubacteria group bacterium QH_9_35_7]|nr:MAG: glycosyltransferase family 2 protein [Parcubacteria group bacterium QH_9_35_7]